MLAGRNAVAVVVALALLLLLPPAAVSIYPACDTISYPANGTFHANLNRLAAALRANASASPAGFFTATVGEAPEQANGLALCRGDTNASTCSACIAAAIRDAQQTCPLVKGVTVIRDACVLCFSGRHFLDFLGKDQWLVSELVPGIDTADGSVNASDAWFAAAVTAIFTTLVNRAVAATNSTRKYFATAEMAFKPKIYGLAQCMPDLTPDQCRGCLGYLQWETMVRHMSGRPPSNDAGVVWCLLRYSVSPVYEGRAMLQLAAPPEPAPPVTLTPATPESGTGKSRIVAGISAGIAGSIVFMLIISVFLLLRFRRRIKATENDHPLKKKGNVQCMVFDFPTLQEATENFSDENKLGEGGFGTVYKGILSDGQEIAVKTLLEITGEDALYQLHNEVLVLAQLQHKNLVRLLGFCSHQNGTLLVYEYIKNGSLDNFLFDNSRGNALHWEQQYNIILGIAKGILYLHEDSSMRIIHRDLKPNNILLDDDMEPKIADFGLARLLEEGHTRTQTGKVAGTLGYIAPEYWWERRVSPKIDIFSFGVLVLEIVTKRRNCSYDDDQSAVNLLSDVWHNWTSRSISQMLDQSLDEYGRSQALRRIHVGLLCVQVEPDDRPDISAVVFMLTRDGMKLQPPEQPAFFVARGSASRSDVSVKGLTFTEPYAR